MKKFTFFLSFAIVANLILISTAFGQITQVGVATTATSTNTTMTITKPVGIQAGDLMFASIVESEGSSGTDLGGGTGLIGWTLIDGRNLGTTNPEFYGYLYYKIATAADLTTANYGFNVDGGGTNNASAGAIVAFRGVNPYDPFDAVPGIINGIADDNSLSPATITTNTANSVVVMFGFIGENTSASNNFSNWLTTSPGVLTNEPLDFGSTTQRGKAVGAAWLPKASAGPTGAGSATLPGNYVNGSILIALKPTSAMAYLSPAATPNVAAGGTVTFAVSAINFGGAGNYTYDWVAPGATIPVPDPNSIPGTSDSKTLTFPSVGSYPVTVTISRTGTSDRVTNTTTVYVVAAASLANAPGASPNPCSAGNAGTPITTNNCLPGTFSASFAGGVLYNNNGNNGLASGSVWRYSNVATNGDGDIFNATVSVDAAFQAVLTAWDNDAAEDENGNQTLQSFFAPSIDPDISLGATNRNGFIQFTIKFWKNGWSEPAQLDGINYSHYDIDGTSGSLGYWFRETGVVKHPGGSLAVTANANTELIPYNYVAGSDTWTGFAGTICNRDNFSRFAEVAANFKYPIFQSSVTIRMGYDYQDLPAAGTYGNQVARLYASKFECFSFPAEINLPVKLISFTGTYKNNNTLLNWVAENQVDFARYEVERSSDGVTFNNIGLKPAQGNATSREYYNYNDNLAGESGNIFYYRLKMVDADGTFKYSKIILIRKDQKTLPGITINPNPLVSGSTATVRFEVQAKSIVTFRVIDMSGRVLLSQQNNVAEGINSVSVNNFERLQPGTYVLQMNDGTSVQTTKFIISQ